jgi:excisionase family DNA binding protein
VPTETTQPPTPDTDDDLLAWPVPHAGRKLGLSRDAAYRAARSGQLPTIRIGRRLLVPRAALERMLDGVEAVES